jgi:hypothetical protein
MAPSPVFMESARTSRKGTAKPRHRDSACPHLRRWTSALYGRWYAGGRRPNRRIGLKRKPDSEQGLGKIEAEDELRQMILRERPLERSGNPPRSPPPPDLMIRELEEIGRKPSTLDNYRNILNVRLLPRFGEIRVDRVRHKQVEVLATQMIREGLSAHTRANTLKLLSQVFNDCLRQR